MGDQPCFYRREEDWIAIVERLKQTSCPHCKTVGMPIRHGVVISSEKEDISALKRKTP